VKLRPDLACPQKPSVYEIGLIKPLRDTATAPFMQQDLRKLTFWAAPRALGFSIEDCRNLLALYEDQESIRRP
jgi:DNA-binding transcriptional MerR regulator